MSKFYRNGKGFLSSLTRGSGLYLLAGATALVLLCLGALFVLPQPEDSVSLPSDTSTADQSDQVAQGTTDSSQDGSAPSTDRSDLPNSSDGPVNAPVEDPVADVSMIVPVSGTVGTAFSLTVPVFSETMNDWRVHQGIDFLTEGEVSVVAAADGIVENVYTSELMGVSVEIRHKDGTISIYQSLADDPLVIEGQEIRQGDQIGVTGTSADSECLVGAHLHFALIRDGIYLDPNERFAS